MRNILASRIRKRMCRHPVIVTDEASLHGIMMLTEECQSCGKLLRCTMQCPKCAGQGFVDTLTADGGFCPATCPRCQGKARVPFNEIVQPWER